MNNKCENRYPTPLEISFKEELEKLKEITEQITNIEKTKKPEFCNTCMYPLLITKLKNNYLSLLERSDQTEKELSKLLKVIKETPCSKCIVTKEEFELMYKINNSIKNGSKIWIK